MSASDLFKAGRLREAIDAQLAKVKSAPTDQPARFFLFELFLFAGETDRARKQLDALKYDDPKHTAAVEQYRNALDSEVTRRAVFAGTAKPQFLSQDGGHLAHRLEAVAAFARNDLPAAATALAAADAATPATPATLDGVPCPALSDADDLFGPVLEVFGVGGVYSWVPFEAIRSVVMNPPAAPRDILFRPAHLVLDNDVEGDVLLPALYPNSHTSVDEELRLGRAADWVGEDGQPVRGVGGRQYRAGERFVPLADVRVIAFGPAPTSN